MADEEDVRELRSGNPDMEGRDLRDADFSGLDLSKRDFTRAHLQGANFSGANLAGVTLTRAGTHRMIAEGVNLSGAIASLTDFPEVNLRNANLQNSVFKYSIFHQTDLTEADLSGADFTDAAFMEGTNLDGCIVDANTKFDRARVFRPLSRHPVFRYYRYEKGVLVRRSDVENPNEATKARDELPQFPEAAGTMSSSRSATSEEIVRQVDVVVERLLELAPPGETEPGHRGIGHNHPPEATPIERSDYDELISTLGEVRDQVESGNPDPEIIGAAQSRFSAAAWKVAHWAAQKANLTADEFFKQMGKTLGDGRVWIAAWLIVSGLLEKLGEALTLLIK